MLRKEDYVELVREKLQELEHVADILLRQTIPYTPLPRPRFFKIGPYTWPYVDDYDRKISYNKLKAEKGYYEYLKNAATSLCDYCKYQPAKVVKVIRQIEYAIEWCKKRTEGRQRAAEEIIKQQKKAYDILVSQVVAKKLQNP